MSARAERRRVEREALRLGMSEAAKRQALSGWNDPPTEAEALRAAYTLMAATDEAVRQQNRFEANGLDPRDVHGPVLSEDGKPLAERLPGTDAAGRVIVVTRKAALGPAVWYYTSREAGLDAMTRPAVAAFNAAKAGRPISPLMWRAMSCHVMALADAKARDAAALAAMPEGGRA